MHIKIIIIGGVAGGATTAARLRRLDEDAQIIMIERGLDISFATCGLPYFISGQIEKQSDLNVQTPESFNQRFNVDVRTNYEVISIDKAAHRVMVRDHKDGQTDRLCYRKHTNR